MKEVDGEEEEKESRENEEGQKKDEDERWNGLWFIFGQIMIIFLSELSWDSWINYTGIVKDAYISE